MRDWKKESWRTQTDTWPRRWRLDPDYADALTLRGILELDKKQPEAAIADLDKAIKADANCALAYMVMGSALNMESKYDEAIHALERGEISCAQLLAGAL